jgi:hypothetical protein
MPLLSGRRRCDSNPLWPVEKNETYPTLIAVSRSGNASRKSSRESGGGAAAISCPTIFVAAVGLSGLVDACTNGR